MPFFEDDPLDRECRSQARRSPRSPARSASRPSRPPSPSTLADGGRDGREDRPGLDFSGIDEPAIDTPGPAGHPLEGHGGGREGLRRGEGQLPRGDLRRGPPPSTRASPAPRWSRHSSGLIEGWSIGLTGREGGQPRAAPDPTRLRVRRPGQWGPTPGNATLWFVIDVVGIGQGSRRSRAGQSPHARAVRRCLGGGARGRGALTTPGPAPGADGVATTRRTGCA